MTPDRAAIERVLAQALRDLDPAARVAAALPPSLCAPRSRPRACSASAVRIIAVGKTAPAMAGGALARLGDVVERCLVVTAVGTDATGLRSIAERAGIAGRVELAYAGHPLPDARSVRAGEACLAMVAEADARATILVLVSGGASALVCAPAPGITLRTKRAITRAMLASGASIQDVNVVRKHLSRLKGGGLLRAAAPRSLLTFVASDVIGGTASDVGSGPSVPDDTTVRAARSLLRRFAPRYADVPLVRTRASKRAPSQGEHAAIVVCPEDLARAMAALFRDGGMRGRAAVKLLPPSQAAAETLAAEYVALAARASRPSIFVRAAEPSVNVTTASGRGGRSTHLAALVGKLLAERCAERAQRVLFAALASDGVDGLSETGGAIVDGRFAERAAARLGAAALPRSLARFDTGVLHRELGTAIAKRATGQNLADVHVLVIS